VAAPPGARRARAGQLHDARRRRPPRRHPLGGRLAACSGGDAGKPAPQRDEVRTVVRPYRYQLPNAPRKPLPCTSESMRESGFESPKPRGGFGTPVDRRRPSTWCQRQTRRPAGFPAALVGKAWNG
jgi:hypothetical protein